MQEKIIKCCDCKLDFVWSPGEQLFLQGLVDDGRLKELVQPKRCKECRAIKKAKYL